MAEVEYCTRCRRQAPAWDSPEYVDWELDREGSGEHVFGLICPGCITAAEAQAISEELEEMNRDLDRRRAERYD